MRKILFFTLLIPFLSLSAAKTEIPFEINYYGISPGAEALSMGYAFSGYGISPASVFWNPANISLMKFSSLYFDFAKYDSVDITDLINYQNGLNGARLDFLSLVSKEGGISWHPISISEVDDSIISYSDSFVRIKGASHVDEILFTITSMTGNLSYKGPVYYGFNIKYYRGALAYAKSVYANDSTLIDNDIEIDYSNGFGTDAGVLYDARKLRIGFTVSNIFSRVIWANHNTARIPTRFNLALAIVPNNYVSGDFEVTKFVTNSPFIFSLGLSGKLRGTGSWYNNLRFSGGVYSISSSFNLNNSIYSFGLGYFAGKFRIATAISGYKNQFFPNFHPEYRVSLSLTQNKEL